jgi:[protein-PII] uridylyltransferase
MTSAASQRCKQDHEAWRKRFGRDGLAMPVLAARTELVDAIVHEAYQRILAPVCGEGVALLAVGGYGRRKLFPYSDVDLLLLARRAIETPAFKTALGEFLRELWDTGLRVSNSVHTVEECTFVHEGNFELTVSLLDQRLLAGDASLYALLEARFPEFLQAERRDLARRLCRMTRARHTRFNSTIYRLEPDVKEAPGGLRDLQTVHWFCRLRQTMLDPEEYRAPTGFLAAVRCFLHFQAGRDQNLLGFEAQDDISQAAFSPWRDPSEWMRAYYRNSLLVFRAALAELETAEGQDRGLLNSFRDWRSRLSNSEFTVSRDLVFMRNPQGLEADPELPLRLFLFVARHGIALARDTETRVADHVSELVARFSSHPPRAAFWREFLNLPHAAGAIRAMRATGFLACILPEWERIDNLVVRDFYHQYTVDEHTTVTLDALELLREPGEPVRAIFAQLLEECGSDGWLLRLALLLHDLGKGSGRDHCEEASRLARVFLTRIGAGLMDADTVTFLVEKHLLLSTALQSKDIADPATSSSLAQEIRTVERLRLLMLLTYADVSAVNPTAMTAWRMEQLASLYRKVYRYLTGELTLQQRQDPRAALGELDPLTEEFLDGLPRRYLWTHTRDEAAAHAALYGAARDSGAEIAIERSNGAWRMTLVAPDRPYLFASIAGALSSFGLDILKAEAFTNSHGYAADGFVFVDPHHSLDLNPTERDRLKEVLRKVALGESRTEDLLRHRPVKAPPSRLGTILPSVTVDDEASPSATVFEVVAQDRPGLLYHLALAISRAHCNIEVVLVDTEAHKALDVFHVTAHRARLQPAAAEALRQALLQACGSGSAS